MGSACGCLEDSALVELRQRSTNYSSSMKEYTPINPQLTKSWISKLNQNTPVSMLSIPGTHDSGTYDPDFIGQFSFSSQCQSWTIKGQLESGIRYFDLRVKYNDKGTIITHHGSAEYHDF